MPSGPGTGSNRTGAPRLRPRRARGRGSPITGLIRVLRLIVAPLVGTASLARATWAGLAYLPTFVIGLLVQRLGRLAAFLDGDDRLAALLVPIGIACFILGNLAQFLATFN